MPPINALRLVSPTGATPPGLPNARPASRPTWVRWAALTAIAAATTTVVDTVLLQLKQNFFTGGFLATDYAGSTAQRVAFLVFSWASDASVLCIIVGLCLWLCGRLRLSSRGTAAFTFVLSVAPVLAFDFVSYRLAEFLGDAFDLDLMFRLSGRNPRELLAVSFTQLSIVATGIIAITMVASWLLWRAVRWLWTPSPAVPPLRPMRAVRVGVLALVAGMLTTTVARSSSDVLDNGLRRKPLGEALAWAVQMATDVDGDGSGALGRPSDPNLFDSRVHPYALDTPGDGIDEDGIAGDLPASTPPYREAPPPAGAWSRRPTVVVVLLESVRSDAIGSRYRGTPVTPVLDALGAQGVSTVAYSHNGFTVQSRHHLFSGSVAGLETSSLIDDFNAHGYQTAYFSAQDESFGGPAEAVGFERADVRYDARMTPELRFSRFTTPGSLAMPWQVLEQRVGMFLDGRQDPRPLFLYVNYQDSHFPYTHPGIASLLQAPTLTQAEIEPGRSEELKGMYLNTVANVDRSIGHILDQVRAHVSDNPAVVVLSDHGESLFDENYLGHGYALNDTQTRVPLIVANLPAVINEPAGQSDIRKMILQAMAAPASSGTRPQVRNVTGGHVFQYLGDFEAPSEIGLLSLNGRTIYDFRADRVMLDGHTWQRPSDLTGARLTAFQTLVQTWERMMLARHRVLQ